MVRVGKMLGFNVFVALLIANVFFIYFNDGSLTPVSFSFGYLESVWIGVGFMVLIWLLSLSVNASYVVTRAVKKKNMLRLPFFVYLIIFLVCLVYLIIDLVNGTVCYSCISSVVLLLLVTLLNYLILRDLHNLVNRIFGN